MAKLKTLTPFHYNAPLVILVCYDKNVVWKNSSDRLFENYNSGEQDASIAATTMMYEAEELGIHSVWIRGFDSKSVMDVFALSENIIPVMMLVLGYPNEKAKANAWHFKRNPIGGFRYRIVKKGIICILRSPYTEILTGLHFLFCR